MEDSPHEAPTGSALNLPTRASLRRHARVAAAYFAAQAQFDIDDEALALIAEFMVAVTLTADTSTSFPTTGLRDDQMQPIAIAVPSHASRLHPPVCKPGHVSVPH
jgi:hypothetical protein